tara:strand:- start:371 stop:721 length:351 start_codon:yes stop_codon:yes gene_type:complete
MRIEYIILGVIAIVLIVDFLLNGIKKKDITDKNLKINSEAFSSLRTLKIRQNIIAVFLIVSLALNFNLFQQIKGDNNAVEITEQYMNEAEEYMNDAEKYKNEAYEYMYQAKQYSNY